MAPSRMSKREQKDLRRLRREEALFRERRRRFRLNLAVVGGAVLVAAVVLGLVALSIHNRGGGSTSPSSSTSPTAGGTGSPTTPATSSPTGAATGLATAPVTVPSGPETVPTASGSPAR